MSSIDSREFVIYEINDGMALKAGNPRKVKCKRIFKKGKDDYEIDLEIDQERLEELKKKCQGISVKRWGKWTIDGLPSKEEDACSILKDMKTETGEQRFPEFCENSFCFEYDEKVFPIGTKTGFYEGISTVSPYLLDIIDRLLLGDVSAYKDLAAYPMHDEVKPYAERLHTLEKQIFNQDETSTNNLSALADAEMHKNRTKQFLQYSHLEAEALFNPTYNIFDFLDLYYEVTKSVKLVSKKKNKQIVKK